MKKPFRNYTKGSCDVTGQGVMYPTNRGIEAPSLAIARELYTVYCERAIQRYLPCHRVSLSFGSQFVVFINSFNCDLTIVY